MQVVDQREAARLPFRSRYPSAKLVAWLLSEAGLLRFGEPLRVLDVTYGQGVFWDALKGRVLVAGFDIKRLGWVVRPRCFFEAPAWAWRYRVDEVEACLGGGPGLIAVDPPWEECAKGNGCRGREPGARYHYRVSRAVGRPQLILEAAASAALHWSARLLVHYKERWVPEGFAVVVEAYWKPFLPNVDKYGYRNWWGVLAPRGWPPWWASGEFPWLFLSGVKWG
ncbi:MAG: hypothetical protein GSR80_000627 [Desulfurococcales archaeon]|nr:hypothetical protein [Desulfurococcales archaeon]